LRPAHLGKVGGAYSSESSWVENIGTSTCHMMVVSLSLPLPDSILSGYYGLEAGQSAVGDIFNWFADLVAPGVVGCRIVRVINCGGISLYTEVPEHDRGARGEVHSRSEEPGCV